MATKNFLFLCKSSVVFAVVALLVSCETGPVKAPQNPQILGPSTPTASPSATPIMTPRTEVVSVPDFVGKKAPRVGLILGPGGAKTLAQIGFLQELEKYKVPVVAVAGLEWGSVVGALYARHGQSNEADWKMSQFPKIQFTSKNFFSEKKRSATLKEMDGFLQKISAQYRLEQGKLPFACPHVRGNSGRVGLLQKGAGATILRQCAYFPPLVMEVENRAAPFALAEAVAFVKGQGAELVVLVNVLDSADRKQFAGWESEESTWLSWAGSVYNLKQAALFGVHEVVSIDTNSFAWTDFEQRLRLIQAGRQGSASALSAFARKYDF